MKHEAFSEAVSMIDNKFVEEAQKPFRKRKSAPAIKICFAAAACAAAICAFLFIPRGKASEILVRGENPSASPVEVLSENGRSGAIEVHMIEAAEIPIEINVGGKTDVSVSGGEIFTAGNGAAKASSELEINESAEIIWSVVLASADEEFTLSAKTGNQIRILELAFDKDANGWVIREKSAY